MAGEELPLRGGSSNGAEHAGEVQMREVEARRRTGMCIWYDDEETRVYPIVRWVRRVAAAPPSRVSRPIRVTAEWQRPQAGHPSTYGLLGAFFAPSSSGTLYVNVAISEEWEPEINPETGRPVVFQKHPGISHEWYSKGIYEAVMDPVDVERLGSGMLIFDRAVEQLGASSPFMYGCLGLAIVRHLQWGYPRPNRDESWNLGAGAVRDAMKRIQ